MVTQDIKFKDEIPGSSGSRIYHEKKYGVVYRKVVYTYGDSCDNVGKYYYLKVLEQSYQDIAEQTYEDILFIYNRTTNVFDLQIVKEICERLKNRSCYPGEGAFFTLIYMAMVDLEQEKKDSSWPGKKLVLDSCRAVLLDNMHYEEAAILGTKYYTPKNHIINDDEPF